MKKIKQRQKEGIIMRRYINITGRIVVEARDRYTNEVLWTYEDVTSIDHDKYYFYIYTRHVDGPVKLSKTSYRIGIRGEI